MLCRVFLVFFLLLSLSFSLHAQEKVFLFLGQDIPPYFFINKNKEITGIYPEILKKVCEELKEKCRFEIYPIKRMLKILEKGNAHGTAPFSKIPEREKIYYFSEFNIPSYYIFYGNVSFISKIQNLKDFESEEISVHTSSASEAELRKLNTSCSYCLRIKREATLKNVVGRLVKDKHPLVYLNSQVADYYIKEKNLVNIKGASHFRTPMAYRIGFSKKVMSESDFHRFDRKLLDLEKRGIIKKIL